MGLLGKLLGLETKAELKSIYAKGAQIIDVRSTGEFAGGHIKGSINMPLNNLDAELKKLKPNIPVIAVCASGMRSAAATKILEGKGFEAYNGGGWSGLKSKLGI